MASGRVHIATTVTASAVITAAGVYLRNPDILQIAAGCLAGIMLTPDLDVDTAIRADRYLPSPVRYVWRVYWCPYALAIPHRHRLSHIPIMSTAIRLVYLLWWVVVWQGWEPWRDARMWRAAAGLGISDILHWMLDGMP